MCVWQSHAPAGTSKLTRVVGCDAFANTDGIRVIAAAAAAASSTSRLVSMSIPPSWNVHLFRDHDVCFFYDFPPFFDVGPDSALKLCRRATRGLESFCGQPLLHPLGLQKLRHFAIPANDDVRGDASRRPHTIPVRHLVPWNALADGRNIGQRARALGCGYRHGAQPPRLHVRNARDKAAEAR